MPQYTPDRLYRLVIDGAEYTTSDPSVTPRQLKGMANLDQGRVVFLQLPQGQERRLAEEEVTDLGSNDVEAFITRDPAELVDIQHYRFQVDGTVYESKAPRITAANIRVIADLNTATPLFQLSGDHLRPVSDTEYIDLTFAGVEKFNTTGEHNGGQVITVILNGRPETVHGTHLTYDQLIHLAFPTLTVGDNLVFTLTYRDGAGSPLHSLVAGANVHIKEGMIFNVVYTDKS